MTRLELIQNLTNKTSQKEKYKRYRGAPIAYSGGKTLGVGHILEYLPDDLDKVVSIFIGGGSFECALAQKMDIKVQGYDVFEPLVAFWKQLTENKDELISNLRKVEATKEYYDSNKAKFKQWQRKEVEFTQNELACIFFCIHTMSYGPSLPYYISKQKVNQTWLNNSIKRLERNDYSNIRVELKPFNESLPAHIDDFLYLDPPYQMGGSSKITRTIYQGHKEFDHNELARLLKDHRGGFILSYNDTAEIRENYKDFEIIEVKWRYTLGSGEKRIGKVRAENGTNVKPASEILIIGRKKEAICQQH